MHATKSASKEISKRPLNRSSFELTAYGICSDGNVQLRAPLLQRRCHGEDTFGSLVDHSFNAAKPPFTIVPSARANEQSRLTATFQSRVISYVNGGFFQFSVLFSHCYTSSSLTAETVVVP
ncbi:hypothetical protein XPA_006273 [Xanthoria parietina]